MDWIEQVRARGQAMGRTVYESSAGAGIEFGDGFDAFWILPGEVTSTVPIAIGAAVNVEEILAQYDAIDRLRDRALHAIKHHLAAERIAISLDRTGQWGLEFKGGMSTSMAVGAYLTSIARDRGDVHTMVHAAFEHTWIRNRPTDRQIDAYLQIDGPPVDAPVFGEGAERFASKVNTIWAVLVWLGLCRAFQWMDEGKSTARSLVAAALPTGRIARMMLRVNERLPGAKASLELLQRGRVTIKFSDAYYDGWFNIDTASRELAAQIRAKGSQVVGDELADRFLRIDAARVDVFGAIHTAAIKRGWKRQEIRMPLIAGQHVVYLGTTVREMKFEPERISTALAEQTPEAVLREAFESQDRTFAEACVQSLRARAATGNKSMVDLPEADLRPRDLPVAPPLIALDATVVAELNAFAKSTLQQFMATREALWKYRDEKYFDRTIDDWASMADWVRLAEQHISGEWPDPTAIIILLDANDPRGDAEARRYLERANPHHEVSDSEVAIVWRYRFSHQNIAREWFAPKLHEDVPYQQARARLGDLVAIRMEQLSNDTGKPADRFDSDESRTELHQELLTWARNSHRWAPPNDEELLQAMRFGWRDVADALSENPYLLSVLLTRDRRPDQFDEPGLLLSEGFLLTWSRFSPSTFLAQLLATGKAANLLELAEEASKKSAEGNPQVQANVAMSV